MSDDYCKCKNCKYADPSTREPGKSWKWHCDWYSTYEDPDEVRECPPSQRKLKKVPALASGDFL